MKRLTFVLGAAAIAALALLTTTGCTSAPSPAEAAVSANAPDRVIAGTGSTFVAPLMGVWVDGYQQLHPKTVINYRPVGSAGAIEEFKKGWPAFAASDAPICDDDLKGLPPAIQAPVTAGPVCFIYNLPGLKQPLRLSSKALAGIYLGTIINWRDPEIAKTNTGVTLPAAPVIVIHRSDGSGTTSILTTYLSKVSQDWSSKAGRGLSVSWPVGLGGEGSKGVLNLVKQTPGTIGYVELNYAKDNSVPVAAVENRAGAFVQPTPQSSAAAIEAFKEDLVRDLRTPIVDPPASARDAYPVAGFTFLLVFKDKISAHDQSTTRDFITYAPFHWSRLDREAVVYQTARFRPAAISGIALAVDGQR